jgi:hypothetical protein
LNEAALTILRSLERIDGNLYVLPGHKTGQHLVNVSKPWQRVRKAAGVEDVRLHMTSGGRLAPGWRWRVIRFT